jgi:ribose transport system substrate-binding protein
MKMSSRAPNSRLVRWMGLVAACVMVAAASGAAMAGAPSPQTVAKGIAHAKANLAKYKGEATYPAPGPAFNASSAAGKTIEYIPIDGSIPGLVTLGGQVKVAAALAGVKVFNCDGKSSPLDWKRCVDEGVARKVGAIILESFAPELVTQSIQAADAAGIPVIDGNNGDPTATGGAATSEPDRFVKGEDARVAFEYSIGGSLIADWVIADSKGSAHVLIMATSDVANVKTLVNKGIQGEFRTYCPNCKVTRIDTPIAQWATGLGPATQAALARDPSINYVIPVYDGMSTFVDQGIKAGQANTVKVATYNGDLGPMQQEAAHRLIYVNVGTHLPYEGWAYVDQALRLMTGHPPVKNEFVPLRVFDRNNIKGLTLTPAGEASGLWYGSASYKKQFPRLWGVK